MSPIRLPSTLATLPSLRYQGGQSPTPDLSSTDVFVDKASIKLERSKWPPFAKQPSRPADKSGHSHWLLDLDELTLGIKAVIEWLKLGVKTARAALSLGVYFSFDTTRHAFAELYAFRSKRKELGQVREMLHAPLAFPPATSKAVQDAAKQNQVALQRVAKQQEFNHNAGFFTALSAFVGSFFMGSGLAFDEVMLGSLFPSVTAHADLLLGIATPIMVFYALGIALGASRELVRNWNRAQTLEATGAKLPLTSAPGAVSQVEIDAHSVASRMLKQRQKTRVMIILAGCAMGIGIGIVGAFSLWGLAIMMPGALLLPMIRDWRHIPQLSAASLKDKINSGTCKDIANNLVYAERRRASIKSLRDSGTAFRSWGQSRVRYDAPLETVRIYLGNLYRTKQEHMQNVQYEDLNPAERSRNVHNLAAYELLPKLSEFEQDRFLYTRMTEALIEDGLFEVFAFEVAKNREAKTWLMETTSNAKHIDLSRESLMRLPDIGPDTKLTKQETQRRRTLEMSKIFLKVVQEKVGPQLAHEQEHSLDLWLERQNAAVT